MPAARGALAWAAAACRSKSCGGAPAQPAKANVANPQQANRISTGALRRETIHIPNSRRLSPNSAAFHFNA